ncbi:MAG: aspartate kinase [Chloroflexi bacterium]|nr:aspartate kinase [Chloroflexota bacterium]MCL5025505.1 aspartate kinase [Chloroflexota bacterium]
MSLLVQKFGGTSVANPDRIRAVAARVLRTQQEGHEVVVVVSAMGDTTDDLIALARQVAEQPSDRELDLLLSTGETVSCTLMAMAFRAMGQEAVALTGAQAGIITDNSHRRARIVAVDPQRVTQELEKGRTVIVAGFQGITDGSDITTLGRGGSDTTAVALAAGLHADRCEIYTDVDGVFTADPRVEPRARKLDEISYEEMLELAKLGARVMHPRAVELGEAYHLPIVVRSSFNDNLGTLITGGKQMEYRRKVRGIAHDPDVAKITVVGIKDRPGVASKIFVPLADAGVNVDVIVQGTAVDGVAHLSFTVSKDDLGKAVSLIKNLLGEIGAQTVLSSPGLAKVSIVGTGIQYTPGYAARMFQVLGDHNINIEGITTSDIRITCLIDQSRVQEAVQALHEAFILDQPVT